MSTRQGLLLAAALGAFLGVAVTSYHPSAAQADGPPEQEATRVLLVYDMEGVATVEDISGTRFGTPAYTDARAGLTAEVNAAIRGLLRGGAAEVVLADAHGSGNPEPDYDLANLPAGARHMAAPTPVDPFLEGVDSSYDAVVAVGMHGRAGGGGFLAHTYYRHTRWVLGGVPMNESLILAASADRFGIPLVLVTGDDVLERELAEAAPSITYVRTKRALGPSAAEPRPEADVLAAIETAAEAALRGRDGIIRWHPPLDDRPVAELGYTLPDHAALAIEYPGARTVDDRTIALDAPTFSGAYRDFRALATFTLLAPLRKLQAALPRVEGGLEVLQRVRGELEVRPSFEPAGDTIEPVFSALAPHGYR